MAQDPSPSTSLTRARRAALVFDYWLVIGLVALATGIGSSELRWSPLVHLVLPLALLPPLLYIFHRALGASPGQFLLGVQLRLPSGGRATRPYDWLFTLRAEPFGQRRPRLGGVNAIVGLIAAFVFTLGATFFLWMRDPTLRPLRTETIALFAPEPRSAADWQIIPFFYATGAFPTRLQADSSENLRETKGELSVEFSLPYEKGPPTRFLGKISAYWRNLDSRLTLTGPLSVASPSTPEDLRRCFSAWFRCARDRRQFWNNSIAPQIGGRALAENYWITTDNPFLGAEERPQGIYLRTVPDRGRIREAYFLVGPKMAVQAFILDRPDRPEGVLAGDTLRKIIGSLRMSSDLQAPRAFVNPKLAALRIGPKSTLADLVAAEGYLLAKVSIEPKEAESFYHLGGLALTLFHAAKREGRVELASSSKTIVKSALRFARDVDSNSKRIPEMERFEAEVDHP